MLFRSEAEEVATVGMEDMAIRCEYESGRGKMLGCASTHGEKQLFTTKGEKEQKIYDFV